LFWSSLKKEPAGAATPLLDVVCGLSPPLLNVQALGMGVGVGVGVAVGVPVGVGVGVGVIEQLMFNVHPPLMLPTSPPKSSKT